MYCTRYDSPVGTLLLTAEDSGLTGIYTDIQLKTLSRRIEVFNMNREIPDQLHEHPVLQQTVLWLDAYFRGEKPPADIPLRPEGTVFRKQVWQLLMAIPYGKSRSYGELARELALILGKEKMSAQAVGQAVGSNPISILIPCHRCVGAKGQLTGYAGGIDKKIWLLRHEGQQGIKELER